MATVLVYGSHPEVTAYVAHSLRRAGYSVLASLRREETLRILEEQPVDALVIGGPSAHVHRAEVVAALRAHHPWAPVVLPRDPDDALEQVQRHFTSDAS